MTPEVNPVLKEIEERINKLIEQNAFYGILFMNEHETLGKLTEEYHEYIEAVQQGYDIEDELMDVAIIAIWGVYSMRKRNG